MNWNQALFPSLKRRGGCAIKKMSRSNLSSRRRGGQIGEIFRPEEFGRTDHPVCGASEASRLFINAAATPPFQGGECVRTETVCQLIPTFSALGKLSSMEQSPKGRQIQSVLPPLRGLTFWHRRPRAYALGYDLFAAARLNKFIHTF